MTEAISDNSGMRISECGMTNKTAGAGLALPRDGAAARYWPTLLLIDKRGVVRYAHVGEGAYNLTEQTILRLLGE